MDLITGHGRNGNSNTGMFLRVNRLDGVVEA